MVNLLTYLIGSNYRYLIKNRIKKMYSLISHLKYEKKLISDNYFSIF